tara:strand:- start:218 stop:946 length:729 start_codon:yes stop_codon:yes gene_type:complete
MSKQLKYKFKKTLKNAEFVHADLEYHRELLSEAKTLFNEAVRQAISGLDLETQKRLQNTLDERSRKNHEKILQEAAKRNELEESKQVSVDTDEVGALVGLDDESQSAAGEEEAGPPTQDKEAELKKLFYRIAEQSHPDKVQASGFSLKEAIRLEKIFKKALEAYNNNNWYVLYSIAVSLDIDIQEISDKHVDWAEDDIRRTMGEIAIIANLLAWVWYTGDDVLKSHVLVDYFHQVFNYQLEI